MAAIRPNLPFTQPHYPCQDAPPYRPMSGTRMRDPDAGPYIFYADVPEYDYYLSGSSYQSQPVTVPKTFPVRNSQLRPPRCVRFCTPGTTSEPTGNPEVDFAITIRQSYEGVAIQLKNYLASLKKQIYFNFAPSDGVVYNLPHGDWNTIIANQTINPDDGTGLWSDLDPNWLTDNCVFLGETLVFVVTDIFSTDAYIAPVEDPHDVFHNNPSKNWDQYVVPYGNRWYELAPKVKVIYMHNSSLDGYPVGYTDDTSAHHQYSEFFYTNFADRHPKGWEIGPAYTGNFSYMRSIIEDFWRL